MLSVKSSIYPLQALPGQMVSGVKLCANLLHISFKSSHAPDYSGPLDWSDLSAGPFLLLLSSHSPNKPIPCLLL